MSLFLLSLNLVRKVLEYRCYTQSSSITGGPVAVKLVDMSEFAEVPVATLIPPAQHMASSTNMRVHPMDFIKW